MKASRQTWFLLSVYASLGYVVYLLASGDVLQVPKVVDPLVLAASGGLLAASFLAGVRVWQVWLRLCGCPVSSAVALASSALAILGKYVPGKVWSVLGRAEYVHLQTNCPRIRLSLISLAAQVVEILIGLATGGLFLLICERDWLDSGIWGWALGAAMAVAALVWSQLGRLRAIWRRLAEALGALHWQSVHLIELMVWSVLGWLLMSISFTFFAESLFPGEARWYLGLAFALAGTLGILAILLPGGIGIREGLLVALPVGEGLDLTQAATLAVASRFWFLVAEIAFFVLGMIAGRMSKP